MTKTYTISRADLKAKRYKQTEVKQSSSLPSKRDTTQLVKVLKKVLTT